MFQYCQQKIDATTTPSELVGLVDKMLSHQQLVEDEANFTRVCEHVSRVNRSRLDSAEISWDRAGWQAVSDKMTFKITAADMQRATGSAEQKAEMIDIEKIIKPTELLSYLDAIAHLEPIVVKAILAKAGKHSEAMLQSKTWSESVVDGVQYKIKAISQRIDPQPQQQELGT